MTSNILTQSQLKTFLQYNQHTGTFHWIDNRHGRINIGDICGWNVLLQNKEYRMIQVLNKTYLAHRLAWLYIYGTFPSKDIDHINGKGRDNRIKNLRVVTHEVNMFNKKRYKNNKTGCSGVIYQKKSNAYSVSITIRGKRIFLGYFKNIWDAICKKKSAEYEHGFHSNHGN